MSRFFRLLRSAFADYPGPVFLVIIACIQIYRVQLYNQSPWKGGGFGMFATSETPDAYLARCYVRTKEDWEPVLLPGGLRKNGRLLRTIPTRANLLRLTDRLACQIWLPRDYYHKKEKIIMGDLDNRFRYRALGKREPKPPELELPSIFAVRVELWKVIFVRSSGEVKVERMMTCERICGRKVNDAAVARIAIVH